MSQIYNTPYFLSSNLFNISNKNKELSLVTRLYKFFNQVKGVSMSHFKKIPAKMVAERIRELRIQKNLSQTQLSCRAGLDRSYISKIERGVRLNVSLDVLMRLADELGCEVSQLLSSDAMNVNPGLSEMEAIKSVWQPMAEEMDVPVILVDKAGYILGANTKFHKYTGYRKDELPFLNILFWLPTFSFPKKGEVRTKITGRNGRHFEAVVSFRVFKTTAGGELRICKIIPQNNLLN